VTPLVAVWVDDALCFCTGPDERKAKNLAGNPGCILTTGCNAIGEGVDVVVEGDAVNVQDDVKLQRIADAYVAKYGAEWTFTVGDGAFHHEAGTALVFEVAPSTAFGFGKGVPPVRRVPASRVRPARRRPPGLPVSSQIRPGTLGPVPGELVRYRSHDEDSGRDPGSPVSWPTRPGCPQRGTPPGRLP